MRIAVNGWFMGQHTTGSGQYLHRLLDRLPRVRSGIEIDVFTPSSGHDPAWNEYWTGVNVIPVDLPAISAKAQKVWWEQAAYPRAAIRRAPDVLWVPYWAAPLWQPIPVVVTVHDVIARIFPAYGGGYRQRAYTSLVSRSARRCAAILTVSHASAGDIVRHLAIPPERVHVVYHGPNVEIGEGVDPARLQAARGKYGLPDRFFLYLGGFDVRKNVESVLRAYKRYLEMGGSASVRLVVAGALPQSQTRVLIDPRPTVSRLGLQDQVTFCGWVEESDKPDLYALATAFLFPSLYEGFGMMALEAMAAGTPVVTSSR